MNEETLPLQKMSKYPHKMEERILSIAHKQGGIFSVSPRWRDLPILNTCKRLVKKGLFKQIKYGVVEVFKETTRI
jgi:hypothetical protein